MSIGNFSRCFRKNYYGLGKTPVNKDKILFPLTLFLIAKVGEQ
jgi:hypothetical protein